MYLNYSLKFIKNLSIRNYIVYIGIFLKVNYSDKSYQWSANTVKSISSTVESYSCSSEQTVRIKVEYILSSMPSLSILALLHVLTSSNFKSTCEYRASLVHNHTYVTLYLSKTSMYYISTTIHGKETKTFCDVGKQEKKKVFKKKDFGLK